MDFEKRFFDHLTKNRLVSPSDRVLLALSGGKDSVCLALLLKKAQEKFGFHLGACHVHHGIRGEEADRDLSFCRDFCEQLAIPFYAERCDVPAYCKENKVGLEEGARTERYRILRSVAKKEGFEKIATAHSASDQAETILFRLIRGTGFFGSRGIEETNGDLVRPLLPFYSEEIEEYVKKNAVPFTQDSTNFDTIYSRNRIRGEIFPLLEEINPKAKEAFCRFGTFSAWQEKMLQKLWEQVEKEHIFSLSDGYLPKDVAVILAKEEADRLLLYHGLSALAKNHNISIDFCHFEAICSLLNPPKTGKIIEISDGVVFEVQKDRVLFRTNESEWDGIEYQIELTEGENRLPFSDASLFLSRDVRLNTENINKKSLNIKLDFDKINGKVYARSLRPSDRIFMYGMHKNVRKMLVDCGIPKELRKKLPVLEDEDGIVWVPFLGLCDKVRKDFSENALTVSLRFAEAEDFQFFLQK